jgi:microsomal dipeptidase-like Zn-dependent dipeptidase
MRGYYERNKGLPGAEAEPFHVNVAELNSPRRLERLATGLARRGYNADAIDKIVGGNIARVLRDAIG